MIKIQDRRVDIVIPFVFFSVLAADQAIKHYIHGHMRYGDSIPVIEQLLHITYIENPGAAFGMLEHRTALFLLVTVIMFLFLAYIYPRIQKTIFVRVAIGMLAGGAMGNAWDRLAHGTVTDFIDFRIWPIFNIADIGIVLGVAVLMYKLVCEQPKTERDHS